MCRIADVSRQRVAANLYAFPDFAYVAFAGSGGKWNRSDSEGAVTEQGWAARVYMYDRLAPVLRPDDLRAPRSCRVAAQLQPLRAHARNRYRRTGTPAMAVLTYRRLLRSAAANVAAADAAFNAAARMRMMTMIRMFTCMTSCMMLHAGQ